MCFGDFNEILWPCEKIGGNDRDVSLMKNFREVVKECNLMDLGSSGRLMRWSNKRYGHGLIKERLDRFLCNKEWENLFLESAGVTLETWTSDHNPIMMTVVEKRRGLRYKRRNFPKVHYEYLWSSYDKCRDSEDEVAGSRRMKS